jgi:signal transduction histidine kinase
MESPKPQQNLDRKKIFNLLTLKPNDLDKQLNNYIASMSYRRLYIPFFVLIIITLLTNILIKIETYKEPRDYILFTFIILLLTFFFTTYLSIEKLYKWKFSTQLLTILTHLLIYIIIINLILKERSNEFNNEIIRSEYFVYIILLNCFMYLISMRNLLTNLFLLAMNLILIGIINLYNSNNSYVLFFVWVLGFFFYVTFNLKLQIISKSQYIDLMNNSNEKDLYYNFLTSCHSSCIVNKNMSLVYTNKLFDTNLKLLVIDKNIMQNDFTNNKILLQKTSSFKLLNNLNNSEFEQFRNFKNRELFLDCKIMPVVPFEKNSIVTFGNIIDGNLQDTINKHIQSESCDDGSFIDLKVHRYNSEETFSFYRVYIRKHNEDDLYEIIFVEINMSDKTHSANFEKNLKNLLLAKISHEFKSPLVYIQQNIDHIQEQTKGKLSSKLMRVSYLAEILMLLVCDICEYAKDSDLDNSSTSIIEISQFKDYLYQLTNILLLVHNKNILIDVKFDEQLEFAKITADEKKLKQIVHNIISNAIKNTTSGSVNIILKQDNIEKYCFEAEGSKVMKNPFFLGMVLIVEDSGKGIDEKYMHYVNFGSDGDELNLINSNTNTFADYANQKGIGLGLPLCKRLCKETHITIKCEHIKEALAVKGTRFLLLFNIKLNTNSFISVNTKVVSHYFNVNQSEKKHIQYSSEDEIYLDKQSSLKTKNTKDIEARGSLKDKSLRFFGGGNRQNSVIFNIPDIRRFSAERPAIKFPLIKLNTGTSSFTPEKNNQLYGTTTLLIDDINFDHSQREDYKHTIIFKNPVTDGTIVTVFVVDDNITNQDCIINVLRLYHKDKQKKSVLQIKRLNDGVELLYELYQTIIRGKEIPSLIICDEMMEYLNGSETYMILAKNYFEKINIKIPFVICSAFEDEGHFEKMKRANISHSFKKPLSKGNVEYIMENIINK